MAYDQGYYQPPQRPYNGRADTRVAPRPGPPQGYNQAPLQQQQYPPQQYAQEEYGYDDYGNGGYAQEYDGYYNNNMNSGGRGNGYPEQNQNYAPQQEYFDDGRGGMQTPRGGRGGPPMQRPPTADSSRGGWDQRGGGQGRGYPNGGPVGRGGRPAPMERSATSDPGGKHNKHDLEQT
jgi:hypothetical protein